MKNHKLAKVARVGAVVCSFGLIAVYVSCRAGGERGQTTEAPAVGTAEPAAGAVQPEPVTQQDFFPGSKSAEVFPPPPPPLPPPPQQAPPPKKQQIMPGSKSAPIMQPR